MVISRSMELWEILLLQDMQSIVLETLRSGYVGNDGIDLGVFINITDDSVLTHNSPSQVDQLILGAGATTVLSGQLLFENNNTSGSSGIGDLGGLVGIHLIGKWSNQLDWKCRSWRYLDNKCHIR